MNAEQLRKWQEAELQDMLDKIAKHGWAVQGVFGDAETEAAPFAYTVGLTAKRLPELVIYGLDVGLAGNIVNSAATQMIERGEFAAGQEVGRLIKRFDMVAIEVLLPIDLRVAAQIYGQVRAIQLVWPDKEGRFPWQAGYGFPANVQPLMGVAPDVT
ncbi:DUF4262 domain-containing protein [Tomitella biformata]|uniref:DUF4262 domain-containing protein n=1 Tax=Tomitella biformata TaxID=630403 RepID=UPI00046390D6|nr:DUF4262 domain-containing protein [Tomitella biformata]